MNEKHLVKLLWIVKACLVAILAYVGFAAVANRLHLGSAFDPGTACGEQPSAETQAALPENRAPSDYSAIVQRDLFAGTQRAGHLPTDAEPLPLPQTLGSAQELGLSLIGAIAGATTTSRAIIQNTQNHTTGIYRIGDSVAGATVEVIQRDLVIVRYQGQSLVLPARAGQTPDKGSKAEDARPKTPDSGQKTDGRSRPASSSSQIGSVSDVFRQATIEPYVKNDRIEGLRLTGLEEIPLAGRLGLQNGDVIQRVNGQQLTSKQKAFQILMKAKTLSKVDIQLLRDGKSRNLSFNL